MTRRTHVALIGMGALWTMWCVLGAWDTARATPGLAWASAFWRLDPLDLVAFLRAIGRHGVSVIATVLIDCAAMAYGIPMIAWVSLRRRRRERLEAMAVGLLLVLPLAMCGFGLTGLFRPPVLAVSVMIAAPIGIRFLMRRSTGGAATGISLKWSVVLMVPLLAPSFLAALAPQTQYDALQYHFALPREFLAMGRIYVADPVPLSNLPLAMEMVYAYGMALGGDGVAQLLNWQLLPLLLICTGELARIIGLTGFIATVPGVLLATSPLLGQLAGQGMTDLAPAVMTVIGASLLMGKGASAMVVLSGLCLGAASAAKLSGAATAFCVLIVLMPADRRIIALASWCLPQLPWLAKNFLMVGAPVVGIGISRWWPDFQSCEQTLMLERAAHWTLSSELPIWLRLPRYLSSNGILINQEISPLFAAALPSLWLMCRSDESGKRPRLAVATFLAICLWAAAGGGQIRYLVPILPLLAIMGSIALRNLALKRENQRWLEAALVIAVLWGVVRIHADFYQRANPLNVALGGEPERGYRSRMLMPSPDYVRMGDWLKNQPGLGRPYLAGDIKAYNWPCNPIFDSQYIYPYLYRWARDATDADRLAVKFRQHRIGCLVYWEAGSRGLQIITSGYPWAPQALNILRRFMVEHLDVIDEVAPTSRKSVYRVYRVRRDAMVRVERHNLVVLPYAEQPRSATKYE